MPLIVPDLTIPLVESVEDCAVFEKTVRPYLPQLLTLPHQVATHATDFKEIYVSTNPAVTGIAFSLALSPVFLFVSELNKNYSEVDRVWSLLPTLYNAHYALWARMRGISTERLDLVLAFSALWSLRLTFNYWRKGGYQIGSEDYRWALVKKYLGQPAFFLLNVVFISSLQSILLNLITAPTYQLLLVSRLEPDLSYTDAIVFCALITLLSIEYIADNQQWDYQQAKKSYNATAKVSDKYTHAEMNRGFCTKGLWKYSRHPNFAAEQAIWLGLYQWACLKTDTVYNWAVVGCTLYLAVFAGSTPLTEWITSSKYPEYSTYQKRVGRFIPKWKSSWQEDKTKTR
ncbi:DUF1295-domain-containing protein [Piedraia hortae CBS 480.64]|uniref:DUF1295-domain-containing protein n=1 Tax=Piedraia hortae CBS 480.64 TaxID=1314780 RepID=A0A6A7BZS7_9PEZI|nr:DUF1295-domain-containing protein [Piedraia hortae CBS 480.64]